MLMSVTHYVFLYWCDMWAGALHQKSYRQYMASVQRKGAIPIDSDWVPAVKCNSKILNR
ncbi:hypothetical protein J6590_105077, partial [Homalodisca vitripennis]